MQYFILQHYFVTRNSLKIHVNTKCVIDLTSMVVYFKTKWNICQVLADSRIFTRFITQSAFFQNGSFFYKKVRAFSLFLDCFTIKKLGYSGKTQTNHTHFYILFICKTDCLDFQLSGRLSKRRGERKSLNYFWPNVCQKFI